eukprot:CAMPEP_0182444710 /NCGR_PEP_ID=MMETSP1172-20130603/3083_1 /TAXON_ID=708627 /ORGANISM="Timspurckia oligopyrenoides, Strain CCMP3278" /LENGTH=838 /DNA_ID=CAMNT_0024640335 /DNA_START=23 /DNA_END=2539 /DNA_ORIENTATION=+
MCSSRTGGNGERSDIRSDVEDLVESPRRRALEDLDEMLREQIPDFDQIEQNMPHQLLEVNNGMPTESTPDWITTTPPETNSDGQQSPSNSNNFQGLSQPKGLTELWNSILINPQHQTIHEYTLTLKMHLMAPRISSQKTSTNNDEFEPQSVGQHLAQALVAQDPERLPYALDPIADSELCKIIDDVHEHLQTLLSTDDDEDDDASIREEIEQKKKDIMQDVCGDLGYECGHLLCSVIMDAKEREVEQLECVSKRLLDQLCVFPKARDFIVQLNLLLHSLDESVADSYLVLPTVANVLFKLLKHLIKQKAFVSFLQTILEALQRFAFQEHDFDANQQENINARSNKFLLMKCIVDMLELCQDKVCDRLVPLVRSEMERVGEEQDGFVGEEERNRGNAELIAEIISSFAIKVGYCIGKRMMRKAAVSVQSNAKMEFLQTNAKCESERVVLNRILKLLEVAGWTDPFQFALTNIGMHGHAFILPQDIELVRAPNGPQYLSPRPESPKSTRWHHSESSVVLFYQLCVLNDAPEKFFNEYAPSFVLRLLLPCCLSLLTSSDTEMNLMGIEMVSFLVTRCVREEHFGVSTSMLLPKWYAGEIAAGAISISRVLTALGQIALTWSSQNLRARAWSLLKGVVKWFAKGEARIHVLLYLISDLKQVNHAPLLSLLISETKNEAALYRIDQDTLQAQSENDRELTIAAYERVWSLLLVQLVDRFLSPCREMLAFVDCFVSVSNLVLFCVLRDSQIDDNLIPDSLKSFRQQRIERTRYYIRVGIAVGESLVSVAERDLYNAPREAKASSGKDVSHERQVYQAAGKTMNDSLCALSALKSALSLSDTKRK